ncbi:MAG: hypothetical protein M3315_13130 [Actinomycetota bacterium]|nr:hypothetical protein [Actinomycetota bacterium]
MNETNRTSVGPPATAESREESLNRAFERVSDAPRREGNQLTLLKNGPQTYDEWLEEIGRAERWIHLENYIFEAGRVGRRFAEALKEKAREGVLPAVVAGQRPIEGFCRRSQAARGTQVWWRGSLPWW